MQSAAHDGVDSGEVREVEWRADQITLLLDVNGLDDAESCARGNTDGVVHQVLGQLFGTVIESLNDTCQT